MAHKEVDFVLGKNTTKYDNSYDPDILVQIPRITNRQRCGMTNETIPFTGYDVWHAWEASFLTNKGLPINGVLKLVIPATSEFIVESKSLKLYLFSFMMEKLGETANLAIAEFLSRVKRDLSQVIEQPITAFFFEEHSSIIQKGFRGMSDAPSLEGLISSEGIEYKEYTENPDILQLNRWICPNSLYHFYVQSNLLRSRCAITGQPDMGTVYIDFIANEKNEVPLMSSLAKYIVSFRDEHHFHEEIIECMYKRIWDKFTPKYLTVAAWYTRRGGIDICPIRTNDLEQAAYLDVVQNLTNARIDYKTLRS